MARQNARGRHNAGLRTAIGSHSQRASGNGGLTGTDIAQQQAVHHAPAIAHVVQNVLECGLLLVAQRKRKGLFKCAQMLARGVGIGHHIDQATVVAQTQRQLQVEALLVGKTPACDVALSHARGKWIERNARALLMSFRFARSGAGIGSNGLPTTSSAPLTMRRIHAWLTPSLT